MNLYSIFQNSRVSYPENTALYVNGETYTYRVLDQAIGKISSRLNQLSSKQVGILASRSLAAFTGILATLKSGKTYVPLNPVFPAKRNKQILEISETEVLIVDNHSIDSLIALEGSFSKSIVLIFPEAFATDVPSGLSDRYEVYSKEDLREYSDEIKEVDDERIAYILFTSGSTGTPKGVPVSHGNVFAYIDYQFDHFDFQPDDRFSQTFDLTFDLSVHDMFICWRSGAALYCVPENLLMGPARFINEHKLTVWFSVPSLAQFMHRFKMLKPGAFPSLKHSLFCGEPLPKSIATSWQKAAEYSIVENIYGPTEATIGITHYRLPEEESQIKELNGVVSIGSVFPTQEYCLIDAEHNITKHEGELCLSGSQVTNGYWKVPEKTKEQFINLDGSDKIWYKTGDIVRVEGDTLFYVTRKDFQVKIRGYRIELEEINLEISKFTGASIVCSVPYPVNGGVADSIYSFVDSGHATDKAEIKQHLKSVLPGYMVPKEILFLDDFPLNANGKIDRNALIQEIC